MVNIDNGIKETTIGYQNCNTNQEFNWWICCKRILFVNISYNFKQHHSTPY